MTRYSVGLLLVLVACGGTESPSREIDRDTVIDSSGFSEEVAFDVPAGTRSVTIVATGANDALYAIGSFMTADGTEHVGIDVGTPPGTQMRAGNTTAR